MRVLLIGLLFGGCAEQVEHTPEVEEVDAVPYWGPSDIYEEDGQCRDLLGAAPDGLTDRKGGDPYLSLPLQTTGGNAITISANGTLSTQGGILNKELQGTKGVTVKVIAVGSDTFGATYTLQYHTTTDPAWRDYCSPGEVASAQRGEWSSTAFRTVTNRISFGCGDAAVKKCYGFGYVPDNVLTSVPSRAHQACTRMARADICGDGTPGTRKLTPIVIRDLLAGFNPSPTPPENSGIKPLVHAPFPAPPDLHFYESAWSWEENEGAVCMERDRWASVGPLSCPNLVSPSVDKTQKFCSELSNDRILSLGGILVNASKTQDKHIQFWQNPATGDVVSTIRGFWREDHGDPEPFPGYRDYLGDSGILLRNPPYSLTLADVAPVYSVKVSANDRALLPSSNPLITTSHPSFEGYLLLPEPGTTSRPGTTPLKRYTRTKPDGTTDTVTGIAPPDEGEWTLDATFDGALTAPAEEIVPLP